MPFKSARQRKWCFASGACKGRRGADRTKALGAKYTSWRGISPKTVKEYNDALEEAKKEFPKAFDQLTYYGSVAGFRDEIPENIANPHMYDGGLPEHVNARYQTLSILTPRRSIVFNTKRVSGDKGQFAYDTPKGTALHEIGHYLDYRFKKLPKYYEERQKFDKMLHKLNPDEIRKKISKYATTQTYETVAEAYAAYHAGKRNDLVNRVHKMFQLGYDELRRRKK